MKIRNISFILPLLISGCNIQSSTSLSSETKELEKVLICYSGDETDEYPGVTVNDAIKKMDNKDYEIKTLSLGMTTSNYESKLNSSIDSNTPFVSS